MLQLADVGCPALAGAAELRTLSFRKAQKRGGSLALSTTGPWPLSLSVWHRSVPAFDIDDLARLVSPFILLSVIGQVVVHLGDPLHRRLDRWITKLGSY